MKKLKTIKLRKKPRFKKVIKTYNALHELSRVDKFVDNSEVRRKLVAKG